MTRDQTTAPQLHTQLAYLLKRAVVDLERLHAEHLAPLGITGRELGVLLLLHTHDPQSQQQTAAHLGVDRTTMVALVDTLETKGLLARRPDPTDRRRNVLDLTDHGNTTLLQALRASDDAEHHLLTDLDPTEATHLRTLLTRITHTPTHP